MDRLLAVGAKAPLRHVEMEMVAVGGVGARTEHGAENPARPRMYLLKEARLAFGAFPMLLDVDLFALGGPEAGNVDRFGEGVVAEPFARIVVASAAVIGGYIDQADDLVFQVLLGLRLHHLAGP